MNIKVVVSDTNIFIDLISIDLLADFFKLPFEFSTTDFVINEITEKQQKEKIDKYIKNGKLTVKKFNTIELSEVISMFQNKKNNVSLEDCSVWYYAKNLSALLLTGDAKLRTIAESDSVKVSGILFVMDKLVELNFVESKIMAGKLKELISINARLPLGECNKRIAEWE